MMELWCEIRTPTTPSLKGIATQIEALAPVATGYLVPDNHLGRPTVSSLVVAQEVMRQGGEPLVCLNARDRNLLGFQRDLLTAGALGVERLLLVQGDPAGAAAGELRVPAMLDEVRDRGGFKVGVTGRLGPLPAWKREADFLFVQVGFSAAELIQWRESVEFDGAVYAGVIVLASGPMARRLAAAAPEIHIPGALIEAVERDPWAGIEAACELVDSVSRAGGFNGVHLVPGVRYRAVASGLQNLWSPPRPSQSQPVLRSPT
jgi:methylenetetrahydrofolate reductase (NADPH)